MAKALIEDDSIHIQGGNDNEEYAKGTTLDRWGFYMPMCDSDSDCFRCRKDGTTWTIFNRRSGTKFRVDFTKQENQVDPSFRPSSPELIDIKITDYCEQSCDFCYQDSGKKGAHAPFEHIRGLITGLLHSGRDRPFEIAFGGGEPTSHPQFADILQLCHEWDIKPNFTTNSKWWHRDAKIREAVVKYVGGYAVSVKSDWDVEFAGKTHDAIYHLNSNDPFPKLNLHYIPDAFPLTNFKEVVKKAGWTPLILLGYKEQGRAKKRPFEHKEWLNIVKEGQCRTGIDTLFAQQYESDLKDSGISDRLYYLEEGKHSLYIDAVKRTYGKSSYCGEYVPYKDIYEVMKGFEAWK